MLKKKLSSVPSGSLNSLIGVGTDGIMQDSSLLKDIFDNVFIMYHRKSDDFPLMVEPFKWKALEASGEVADGVVIVEGGRILVVAPTQAPTTLLWSSAVITGGGFTTSNRETAMYDWEGKANTTSQIAASTESAITNTADYAPGFCNLYSRVNANGKGLTAGKWWLPSLGQLMMIYANKRKINYALSLIAGATPLTESWYWSSTEYSAAYAWTLVLSDGLMDATTKAVSRLYVRAVSAFIS